MRIARPTRVFRYTASVIPYYNNVVNRTWIRPVQNNLSWDWYCRRQCSSGDVTRTPSSPWKMGRWAVAVTGTGKGGFCTVWMYCGDSHACLQATGLGQDAIHKAVARSRPVCSRAPSNIALRLLRTCRHDVTWRHCCYLESRADSKTSLLRRDETRHAMPWYVAFRAHTAANHYTH